MDLMPTFRAALPLAAALLAGCASYRAAPLPAEPRLADSVAQLTGVPASDWLTVAEVTRLALENNPDLRAVRAQRGVAQAQLLQAGLLPNPSVTGAILPLAAGVGTTFAWNAGLSFDVTSLITLSRRREAAAAGADQVNAQIVWQEWQTAGQARLLSVDVIEGSQLLAVLHRETALLASRVELSRQAVAAGNATLTTLAPDIAALQSATVQEQDQARLLLGKRHQLAALLGLQADAPLELVTEPELPALDLNAARRLLPSLAERRPDLIALRLGYAAEDAKLRAAILAQFPKLTFGVTGGSDNSNVRNIGPQISLELPIFDRNQGNIAIENATRQQLYDEYTARLGSVRIS